MNNPSYEVIIYPNGDDDNLAISAMVSMDTTENYTNLWEQIMYNYPKSTYSIKYNDEVMFFHMNLEDVKSIIQSLSFVDNCYFNESVEISSEVLKSIENKILNVISNTGNLKALIKLLEKSKEQYNKFMDSISEKMLSMEKDAFMTYLNRNAYRIAKYGDIQEYIEYKVTDYLTSATLREICEKDITIFGEKCSYEQILKLCDTAILEKICDIIIENDFETYESIGNAIIYAMD